MTQVEYVFFPKAINFLGLHFMLRQTVFCLLIFVVVWFSF